MATDENGDSWQERLTFACTVEGTAGATANRQGLQRPVTRQ